LIYRGGFELVQSRFNLENSMDSEEGSKIMRNNGHTKVSYNDALPQPLRAKLSRILEIGMTSSSLSSNSV